MRWPHLPGHGREERDVGGPPRQQAATIQATCPTCGEISTGPEAVTVAVVEAANWIGYTMVCPLCSRPFTNPTEYRLMLQLRDAGCRFERIEVPDEVVQAWQISTVVPPLSDDDVLDFMLWLATADHVVAAFESPRAS